MSDTPRNDPPHACLDLTAAALARVAAARADQLRQAAALLRAMAPKVPDAPLHQAAVEWLNRNSLA